ncbi:hypothetical protein PGB90_007130 [Kerria lacca]
MDGALTFGNFLIKKFVLNDALLNYLNGFHATTTRTELYYFRVKLYSIGRLVSDAYYWKIIEWFNEIDREPFNYNV